MDYIFSEITYLFKNIYFWLLILIVAISSFYLGDYLASSKYKNEISDIYFENLILQSDIKDYKTDKKVMDSTVQIPKKKSLRDRQPERYLWSK